MNPIDTDNTTKPSTVKVWDWPVRVFHWTLAASVWVLWSSRTHGENLLKAMLTGRKAAPSEAGIHHNWGVLGLAMLLAVAWYMFVELRG